MLGLDCYVRILVRKFTAIVFILLSQHAGAGLLCSDLGMEDYCCCFLFFFAYYIYSAFTVLIKYWVGFCSFVALCLYQSRIIIKTFVFFIVLYVLILCFWVYWFCYWGYGATLGFLGILGGMCLFIFQGTCTEMYVV